MDSQSERWGADSHTLALSNHSVFSYYNEKNMVMHYPDENFSWYWEYLSWGFFLFCPQPCKKGHVGNLAMAWSNLTPYLSTNSPPIKWPQGGIQTRGVLFQQVMSKITSRAWAKEWRLFSEIINYTHILQALTSKQRHSWVIWPRTHEPRLDQCVFVGEVSREYLMC